MYYDRPTKPNKQVHVLHPAFPAEPHQVLTTGQLHQDVETQAMGKASQATVSGMWKEAADS